MGTLLARHVMTRLVDDIDGSEAAATLAFALDGRSYEIDLSEAHLAEFRDAVAPFVAAARAATGGASTDGPATGGTGTGGTSGTGTVAAPRESTPPSRGSTRRPRRAAAATPAPSTTRAAATPAPAPTPEPTPEPAAAPAPAAADNGGPAPEAGGSEAARRAVVDALPFRQPDGARGGAATNGTRSGAKPEKAPLVADPFNPGAG